MARRPVPLVLHLPRRALGRARSLALLLQLQLGRPATPRQLSAFRLKNDERPFARALLERKPNLWLFRSNQFASCGDFYVVDMSSPDPALRAAWVVDLKQGAPLRRGGKGAGFQLVRREEALAFLARRFRVLPRGLVPLEVLTGDGAAVLAELLQPARRIA